MTDDVYDYAMVVNAFAEKLGMLRVHIYEHNFYEGCEQDVADMDKALALYEKLSKDSLATFANGPTEDVWDEFWNHIRDNMQKWWC